MCQSPETYIARAQDRKLQALLHEIENTICCLIEGKRTASKIAFDGRNTVELHEEIIWAKLGKVGKSRLNQRMIDPVSSVMRFEKHNITVKLSSYLRLVLRVLRSYSPLHKSLFLQPIVQVKCSFFQDWKENRRRILVDVDLYLYGNPTLKLDIEMDWLRIIDSIIDVYLSSI